MAHESIAISSVQPPSFFVWYDGGAWESGPSNTRTFDSGPIIASQGESRPHNVMQPSLVVKYLIRF